MNCIVLPVHMCNYLCNKRQHVRSVRFPLTLLLPILLNAQHELSSVGRTEGRLADKLTLQRAVRWHHPWGG